MEDNKLKIRKFLAKYIKNRELTDNEDIFGSGFVNSLFAVQLVLFIESEFSLRIEREDLKLDNFRSISALVSLIDRKRQFNHVP